MNVDGITVGGYRPEQSTEAMRSRIIEVYEQGGASNGVTYYPNGTLTPYGAALRILRAEGRIPCPRSLEYTDHHGRHVLLVEDEGCVSPTDGPYGGRTIIVAGRVLLLTS